MAWNTLEDAIWTWVRDGSGLDTGHVIWSDQDAGRPDDQAYAVIRLGAMTPLGAYDSHRYIDLTPNFPAPAPGAEIEQRLSGLREFDVSVTFFGGLTVGAASARAVASKTQLALALPSVRAALQESSLSPFDPGRVRNVSAILEADFEARAVLEMRFYVEETASEFVTYIEKVELVYLTATIGKAAGKASALGRGATV